jgi:hypothetical protein
MRLILTTITDWNSKGTDLSVPYLTRNPRYLYPERYQVKDSHATGLSGPSYLTFAPEKDPLGDAGLEDLMLKKGEIMDSRIEMLLSEIYQRRKLQDENLNQINLDQCTCRTLIYRMHPFYLDKKKMDMERKIIELEEEKRKEQTSYFRDILFIKKELRDTLIEKLEEEQKLALFAGQQEETR